MASAALIYTRRSKDEDAQKHSADYQERDCRKLAQELGLRVAGVFGDDLSGATRLEKRPGWQALELALGQNKGATVLVWDQSRLARSVFEFADAHRIVHGRGGRIVFADNPNASEFEQDIKAAMAAEERRRISKRIKAALSLKKERGERVGAYPWGFTSGESKRLVPEPQEVEVLSQIGKLREKGMGARRILRELQGTTNPRTGRPFSLGAVQNAIKSADM